MKKNFILTVVSLLVLFSATARSQLVRGVGIRGGATVDPDQVHVGMHLDLGTIGDRVRVQPNVEVGLGDDITLVAINPELFYVFPVNGQWVPYAGGGIGINIFNRDRPRFLDDDTEVEAGVNFLIGIETRTSNRSRLFFEAKAGVGDTPDLKFTAGFTLSR